MVNLFHGHSADIAAIKNPKTRFNWRISDYIRWTMSRWLELRAKITGSKYHCRALAGESDYNITVNSDLTVSCSCQDYDGGGHLGDLRKNSFEEVFFGPIAQKFREDLAKGKMPIPTCSRCGDLQRLKKGEQPSPPRLPYRGMLLENTVICNVDCIGCAREGAAQYPRGQDDAARRVEQDGRSGRPARHGADFLSESGRTVFVADDLPGIAFVAFKESQLLYSRFDKWRFVEHGRQARGGVEFERHPIFRSRHQRRDVREIHDARQF
ncbi:MAG: SPASM domain-containing protein [Limisphaerales bacterium]